MPNDVTIDLTALKNLRKAVQRGLRSAGGSGPIRKAFNQWAFIYRSFLHERFDKFSKGGGNWAGLSPATKRARKKSKKGKNKRGKKTKAAIPAGETFSILRNDGLLYNALQPSLSGKRPGALKKHIAFGVRVGYGGSSKHPSGKGLTIQQIASYHQSGGGRLPQRQIIVDPDGKTQKRMREIMAAAMREASNGNS